VKLGGNQERISLRSIADKSLNSKGKIEKRVAEWWGGYFSIGSRYRPVGALKEGEDNRGQGLCLLRERMEGKRKIFRFRIYFANGLCEGEFEGRWGGRKDHVFAELKLPHCSKQYCTG